MIELNAFELRCAAVALIAHISDLTNKLHASEDYKKPRIEAARDEYRQVFDKLQLLIDERERAEYEAEVKKREAEAKSNAYTPAGILHQHEWYASNYSWDYTKYPLPSHVVICKCGATGLYVAEDNAVSNIHEPLGHERKGSFGS